MRKLTAAVFQSLDGIMQAPGGPEEDPTGDFPFGGWSTSFWDESMYGPVGKLFEGDFDLLLGRRTYDIFAAHWPYNLDDPIGAKFQSINKYVFTTSDDPLEWEGSYALRGDVADVVERLKSEGGRDLLIQGSSTLYPPLLRAGLIDRLVLMTFPVVLGHGKAIFTDRGAKPGAMRLVEHKVSNTGVILATYEPAGEVPIGSFAMDEPSAAELERREKLAREDA